MIRREISRNGVMTVGVGEWFCVSQAAQRRP